MLDSVVGKVVHKLWKTMLNFDRDDITPEILRELLDYDSNTGLLTWKPRKLKWFANEQVWKAWNTKYAGERAFKSKAVASDRLTGGVLSYRFYASRVAWAIFYGSWPTHAIDHINGDETDDRIGNLRDVPQGDNCRNASRRKDNTSGVCGVSWSKASGKWQVSISVNKQNRHVGTFERKADAIAARRDAEREHGFHKNHGRGT
ncbi:HNH endonuclease [Leisingera sp. M523]|uniref:HNH endonuclease n=1 Tax=Leisingera sp. M523 TaxID=2867013 RepID=UPI0021A5CB39|nr:HNH endonuclease [Leisingera sp. M523]UWQ30244.1 HNH endonuclease [Leisingera sp. M523]